ncbi:MAG TPA: hypothetical protein VGJ03_05120 [Acidimicrobiales bacterium]|jgi:hypothetical protein
MDEALDLFVRATDLDVVSDARGRISRISKLESAQLHEIVAEWQDRQAVANLLMYPEVIPAPDRDQALFRGLSSDLGDYTLLASIIGVQRLAERDQLADDVRKQAGSRLVEVARTAPDATAARASIALGELTDDVDLDEILTLVDVPDETVMHNVLAIALELAGREQVRERVARLQASGRLDDPSAVRALAHLESMDGMAALPALTYIPSLADWQEQP